MYYCQNFALCYILPVHHICHVIYLALETVTVKREHRQFFLTLQQNGLMSSRDVPVARSLLVTIIMFTPACWPHGSRCSRRAHSSLHSTSIALPTGLYSRWPIVSITPCTRAVSGVGTLSAAGTLGDVWLAVAHCHIRWSCSLVKQSISCCRGVNGDAKRTRHGSGT